MPDREAVRTEPPPIDGLRIGDLYRVYWKQTWRLYRVETLAPFRAVLVRGGGGRWY